MDSFDNVCMASLIRGVYLICVHLHVVYSFLNVDLGTYHNFFKNYYVSDALECVRDVPW